MSKWPRAQDCKPHDPNLVVVTCRACGGTGCNRWMPKLTAGMWAACPQCEGAGYEEKRREQR